ncbi:MAG: hypothetical protein HUJ25_01905 [Crocinitomicaceae bacterium]|nr:hypothetical protein [Crocinitomicaceae bacterium]
MRFLLLSIFILLLKLGFTNTNNFIIKLDQFTLAKSQLSLNDTIEVTKQAWLTSDSLHLTAYICGANHSGEKASFIARGVNNLLFQDTYTNKGVAYTYSFSTQKINPENVRYVAMTIGAAASENKMGWKYRMGTLKFI